MQSFSDRRATAIFAVAHGALCVERGAAGRAVLTVISAHSRDNKKRKASKKQQNCESDNYMTFGVIFFHDFSCIYEFSLLLETYLLETPQRPLTEAQTCERQIPHPFSRGGEDGVAERRDEWRNARLTDARGRRIALDDVH